MLCNVVNKQSGQVLDLKFVLYQRTQSIDVIDHIFPWPFLSPPLYEITCVRDVSNTDDASPLVKEESFCLCYYEWRSDTGICYVRPTV